MLTGGRSAANLYAKWSVTPEFNQLKNIHIFFGDERCVPKHHPESNYNLVMSNLFPDGVLSEFQIFHMRTEDADADLIALEYEQQLPEKLDLLLLSMGEDGHIASLFPHSPALFETERKVVPVIGPKTPYQRLTITPPVIQSAKQVYVLAIGDEKKRKYEEALLDPGDINSIPARLVLDRTWIFDLNEEIDLCPRL